MPASSWRAPGTSRGPRPRSPDLPVGKHAAIAARFARSDTPGPHDRHPCYLEYFRLFNRQAYYEAHDVLEHIWLGSDGERHTFYKALIQLAGGFVHLQHHHREPSHRIHGRRLRPAGRLFLRSAHLLAPFAPRHEDLDVDRVRFLALSTAHQLQESAFTSNPWSPDNPPELELTP